jgi:hypothetical protein
MDILKLLLDELNITIPVFQDLGDTKENAIKLSCKDNMVVAFIENEIINTILKDEPWKKVEQSLLIDNDQKYDMITVIELLDNGSTKKHVFWFDITECFNVKI